VTCDAVWTRSNGGPLIVLERRALSSWRGVTNFDDPTDPATDYGRACASGGLVSSIPAGAFQCLVLGDGGTFATWRAMDDGIVIVLCDVEVDVEGTIDAARSLLEAERGFPYPVSSDALFLFDSAYGGDEAHEAPSNMERRLPTISIACERGTYDVRAALLPDALVVRLRM
jgi:hypothetical protein